MSDLKIQNITPSTVAPGAPESTPTPAANTHVAAVATDGLQRAVPTIGAERAKASALEPPAKGVGVRGTSKVADASDALWGAGMGLLWADAISH